MAQATGDVAARLPEAFGDGDQEVVADAVDRAGNADRRQRLARTIEDGDADAAGAGFVLLVVDGEPSPPGSWHWP